MDDPFERSVTQIALDPALASARASEQCRQARLTELIQPRIDGQLHACHLVIDAVSATHAAIVDRSDLELTTPTRSLAVWEISGRSLSLAQALIDQLRRGYGPQVVGTARLMYESTVLLEAFCAASRPVVEGWLNGSHVPQRDARAELEKLAAESTQEALAHGVDIQNDPRFRSIAVSLGFAPDADPSEVLAHIAREEYRELSHQRGGHNDRPGFADSLDLARRAFAYGAHPDPVVRATYVEQAGHDIERVVITCGYAFARFFLGAEYQQDKIGALQQALAAARHDFPLEASDIAPLVAAV